MNANDNQKPQDESQREAGLAAPLGSASWGVTRRYGKLITDGEKRAVQIEIDAKDDLRVQVLLSKAMTAVAHAEADVEIMTDGDIMKYLDDRAKFYVTVTPNDKLTDDALDKTREELDKILDKIPVSDSFEGARLSKEALKLVNALSKENERQPASVNEAESKSGFDAPSCSVVEMHVNYFSGKTRTHGYDESWEKLALHCPNCGEKQVWHETSGGDYYVEERYLCTACNHGFYLPGGVRNESDDEQCKQRLEALKENPQ